MSWKLGKKFKDGGIAASGIPSSSSSSFQIDRSATPTPGSMPSSASPTGAPIAQNGILTIRVVAAKGLNLPSGQSIPPAIAKALQQNGNSSSFSTSFSGNSNRQSLQRKQCWWLPYLVLEFDKNEIIINAIGGDISSPIWMFKTNFDVSRASEISIHCYLRSGDGGNGQGGSNFDNHGDAVMGMKDVHLGSSKISPQLVDNRVTDEWYSIGSGQLHVQASYQSREKQPSLTMDDFELMKVIGKGSFGKVMQVRKKDSGRVYALKSLRKLNLVSRGEVRHTMAEKTVLAKVNHPFIVPLKFSFQSPDKLYLVLAFVNGGELFLHLQREGRFSEERSRFYAAQLLCALEHLHSFNVIYRDLKPENILLSMNGDIQLCDFGLCKLDMDSGKTTNTFCGTPEYLSPELLLNFPYSKVVDWWTLGVLLYEMLTGLPPFYSEDVNEMYRKILQDPLRFGDEVSSDARSILTQLLDRDPNKRLGANGASEIKNHPFFSKHIDWQKLLTKQVKPPFKPAVSSAVDTSNFDTEFTSASISDSVVDDSHMLSATLQEQFQGFSYTGQEGGMDGSVGSFRG